MLQSLPRQKMSDQFLFSILGETIPRVALISSHVSTSQFPLFASLGSTETPSRPSAVESPAPESK
jgi:hypothetical protein